MPRVKLVLEAEATAPYTAALSTAGHTITDERPEILVVGLTEALAEGWIGPSPSPAPAPMVVALHHRSFAAAIGDRPNVVGVFDLHEGPQGALAAIARRGQPLDATYMASPPRELIASLDPAVPDATLQQVVAKIAAGLHVEVALVTLIDSHWQTFAAEIGTPEDLASARGTLAQWSFCRHVVDAGEPLIVEDATLHPVFADTPMVTAHLVRAYAGVPVRVGGLVVGAVCAISPFQHAFSRSDVGLLELAADNVGLRLTELSKQPKRLALTEARRAPDVGLEIDGRWKLTAPIGHGGQSSVWMARELTLGRLVAVKLYTDEAWQAEARVLASVRHPNLVAIHAAGALPDGRGYLVLDHVSGPSLLDAIDARGTDRDAFVFGRVSEIAGALNSLHGAGFLHGDLKPPNVLIDEQTERAIVIDLGLALPMNARSDGRGSFGASAPEQFDTTATLNARVDTYGLAALTYQMLTGEGAFQRSGRSEAVLDAQRNGRATPISHHRPDLAHLDAVFAGALSPRPGDRPRSPLEWVQGLSEPGKGHLPNWPTRAEVLVAARLGIVAADGSDAWVVETVTPATRVALDEATKGSAYVPTEALLDYLTVWSAGSPGAVRTLGVRVGSRSARELVRTAHLVFEPHAVLLGIPGMLRRLHPWASIDLAPDSDTSATGTMAFPFRGEVLPAWIAGVIQAVFDRCGVRAKVRWTPLDLPTWRLDISWTS